VFLALLTASLDATTRRIAMYGPADYYLVELEQAKRNGNKRPPLPPFPGDEPKTEAEIKRNAEKEKAAA
jgi:hypothetical protein